MLGVGSWIHKSLCFGGTLILSVIFGHIWGKYKIPSGLSPARGLCGRNLTEQCKDHAVKRMINSECGGIKESPVEGVPLELSIEEGREFPQIMGVGGGGNHEEHPSNWTHGMRNETGGVRFPWGAWEHAGVVHSYALERSLQPFLEDSAEWGKAGGREANSGTALRSQGSKMWAWTRGRPGTPGALLRGSYPSVLSPSAGPHSNLIAACSFLLIVFKEWIMLKSSILIKSENCTLKLFKGSI